MRILLTLVIVLYLPLQANAWNPMITMGGGASSPATSCTIYDTEDSGGDTVMNTNAYNTQQYGGITWIDTVQANDICQVDFYVHNVSGNPALNDYWVEIWLMSGDNLDFGSGVQARSNKVDGVIWTTTWVTFTFDTPFTLSQNTEYAILIKQRDTGESASGVGEYDASNYINLYYDNEGDDTAKQVGRNIWSSADGSSTELDDQDDIYVKIYTMQ